MRKKKKYLFCFFVACVMLCGCHNKCGGVPSGGGYSRVKWVNPYTQSAVAWVAEDIYPVDAGITVAALEEFFLCYSLQVSGASSSRWERDGVLMRSVSMDAAYRDFLTESNKALINHKSPGEWVGFDNDGDGALDCIAFLLTSDRVIIRMELDKASGNAIYRIIKWRKPRGKPWVRPATEN